MTTLFRLKMETATFDVLNYILVLAGMASEFTLRRTSKALQTLIPPRRVLYNKTWEGHMKIAIFMRKGISFSFSKHIDVSPLEEDTVLISDSVILVSLRGKYYLFSFTSVKYALMDQGNSHGSIFYVKRTQNNICYYDHVEDLGVRWYTENNERKLSYLVNRIYPKYMRPRYYDKDAEIEQLRLIKDAD